MSAPVRPTTQPTVVATPVYDKGGQVTVDAPVVKRATGVGKSVLGYLGLLIALSYFARFVPIDRRITVSVVSILLTVAFMARRKSPAYALCLLFANYLCGVKFDAWGQLYSAVAIACLVLYSASGGRRVSLGGWGLFLGVWLLGLVASVSYAVAVLGSALASQVVYGLGYFGCAAGFSLAFQTTVAYKAEDDALLALGWVGVVAGVLALLAVFSPRLGAAVVPGTHTLLYGGSDITPWGRMPKLGVGVEGVALAGFFSAAAGTSLLALGGKSGRIGVTMLAAGVVTTALIFRRSIVVGFIMVVMMVLLHSFGRKRTALAPFAVVGIGLVCLILFADSFVREELGRDYWYAYGQASLFEEARADRFYIWQDVWSTSMQSPWLGVGPGHVGEKEGTSISTSFQNAHNLWLWYVRALGFPVGVLCGVVLLVVAIRAVTGSLKRRTGSRPVFSLSVLGAFFAALILFGSFGDIQRNDNVHVLVWTLAGICAGIVRRRHQRGGEVPWP